MKIKDLCETERPRERLLSSGASSLSNSELLAILIRGGGAGESAVDIAGRLLSMSDGRLVDLFNMSVDRIATVPWVGPCKAASIAAAFELGKRFVAEQASAVRRPVITARSVYEMMIPQLKGLQHEECWAVLLNDRNFLISKVKITSGGGRSTVIDVRQVVRIALEKGASGMILVHNHPSGDPSPSRADLRETESLHAAANACGLSLLDHVIVCDSSFFSFSEERTYSG